MITTQETGIIYDPLVTKFDVNIVGGMLTQRYNVIAGEYETDRSLFPLALCPNLMINDPNIVEGEQASDQTSALAVNWYTIVSGEEQEIVAVTGDYHISGKNLVVEANVPSGTVVQLRCRAAYVNPHTLDVIRFTKDFKLSTQTFVEYNPAVAVNVPNYVVVSPFKITRRQQRVLSGKLMAGCSDISTNAKANFQWQKKDGANFRAITSTDVEVASVNGRLMTLNMDCVGDVTYKLTAWHTDYADRKKSVLMTFHRQFSGHSVKMRIIKGKLLKPDVTESVAEAVVTVNSNEINNPGGYFRFLWRFYRQHGTTKEGNTILGCGVTARADRSLSGTDKTRVPTFQMEWQPLTEFRPVYSRAGNLIVSRTGSIIVGQKKMYGFESVQTT